MPKKLEKVLNPKHKTKQKLTEKYHLKKTVLRADMKGSTELFTKLGDIEASRILQKQRDIALGIISSNNGQGKPIGGDGLIAFFDSPVEALTASVKIQQELQREKIGIRIGLDTGGVFFDLDMQCQTIIVASRIMSLADGGQILISLNTYQEVQDIELAKFWSHGEYYLKGIPGPVSLYEVLWQERQEPQKPITKEEGPERFLKIIPITPKRVLAFGILTAFFIIGLVVIKIIIPIPTGPPKRMKIYIFPTDVDIIFYEPIDYYGELHESPNKAVKDAFENGRILKEKKRFNEAISEFKRCLKFNPDDKGKSATFILIGNCFYSQSKYKKAFSWYNKGMKVCDEISDLPGLATVYNNIGLIYDAQGNSQQALKWMEKSIEIFKKIGNWHSVAVLLGNMSLLYLDTGEKDVAKQYLQESYELFLQLTPPFEVEQK